MNQEMILILDFGGQYNQLIARRVREHHVYCEIMPWKKSLEEIKAKNPKGIIFTGGPNSVYDDASPKVGPVFSGRTHSGYLLWLSADGVHTGRQGWPCCRAE